MNPITTLTDKNLSMTSQQIADLVESRHDHVKRSIDRLVNQGVIVQPPTGDEHGQDAMGRPRTTQVYIFTGEKGKRDSIIVVAQLSPEFTARLVDRWQELERQVAFTGLPNFTDPAAAAMAWAEQYKQREQLALENQSQAQALAITGPKAEALDRFATFAEGTMCITNAAKALQIQPKAFFRWLQEHQWIYRRAGGSGWLAYQSRIQVGYLEHKVTTVERADGTQKVVEQVLITAKGLAKLSERLNTPSLA